MHHLTAFFTITLIGLCTTACVTTGKTNSNATLVGYAIQRSDGEGTLRYQKILTRKQAPGEGSFSMHEGLADANGRTILEPDYLSITAITDNFFLVKDVNAVGGDRPYRIYDLEKDEFLKKRWSHLKWFPGPGMLIQEHHRNSLLDLTLISADTFEPIAETPALDAYQIYGKVLLAHKTLDNGDKVSQVVSPLGEPVSPVLPRIAFFESIGKEFVFLMPVGDLPKSEYDLPFSTLYVPIGPSGVPQLLPEGVIGVTLLGKPHWSDHKNFPNQLKALHDGWVLIYKNEAGYEFAPYAPTPVSHWKGGSKLDLTDRTLKTALSKAAELPRFDRMIYLMKNNQRSDFDYDILIAAEMDDRWRLYQMKGMKPWLMPGEKPDGFASLNAIKPGMEQIQRERKRLAAILKAEEKAQQERLAQQKRDREKQTVMQYVEWSKTGELTRRRSWALDDLLENDDELFLLYVRNAGARHLADKLRYTKLTKSNKYRADLDAYQKKLKAQEEAERHRQELAEQRYQDHLRRKEREAAAAERARRRNFIPEGSGDGISLYDQVSNAYEKRYRDNLKRYNEGGNIIVPPKPNSM